MTSRSRNTSASASAPSCVSSYVVRLRQHTYIHVLDNNTNITRCVVGPTVFTRKDHESILFEPEPCVAIPPRCYCRVRHPCRRDKDGAPSIGPNGPDLQLSHEELRFEQDPFPLQPGEELVGGKQAIQKLRVIPKNTALRIKCTRDFADGTRKAGAEWLFEGPDTYVPNIRETIVETISAQTIKANQALRLKARARFTDRTGTQREVGEEWLVTAIGAYVPRAEEAVVGTVEAKVLTDKDALHLEALRSFTDEFGRARKAGERWLLTNKMCATHIPHVHEKIVGDVKITTLNNREFCVVVNPVGKDGKLQHGHLEVRRGEASFFLHPGEKLLRGVENVTVLRKEEALLVHALEPFHDAEAKRDRQAGESWLVRGPAEYVPPVQVRIDPVRKALALDENEGVYVRNKRTGAVRSVIGTTCLLSEDDVLWEKELPPLVEELLKRPNGTLHKAKDSSAKTAQKSGRGGGGPRDKTSVVRFNVQHNAAVQLYDYKTETSRIVFGPDLVMLEPNEQFTVLSVSGEKPKVPHVVQSLQLFLGPDFSTDHVVVETSDHARLQLKLSYNWRFEVDKTTKEGIEKIFSVPDFVGDMCKTVASRIRGAVAAEDFDNFHRHSARIIRSAVFGVDANGKIKDAFRFPANNLLITNIDIQSAEPTDTRTRDSLQQSVQLAIEITTKSQEAAARHDSDRKDQEAKGRLDRQMLEDKVEAEKARKSYLELTAESEGIQACGQAVAEAKARSEAQEIEAQSEAQQAVLRAEAFNIAAEAELSQLQAKQESDLEFKRKTIELELHKAEELADIEAKKLEDTMAAIGKQTLVAIAEAGPETQAKLLEGLGLKGYLITDGNSPINLFNTAESMVKPPTAA